MASLMIRSYLLLVSFEWHIVRRDFRKVYDRVQAHAVRPPSGKTSHRNFPAAPSM